MTYTVHWSSQINGDTGAYAPGSIGKNTINLADNTSDSSTTLTLTGRGFSNYGRIQQENFIHLLENFASTGAPLNPTIGQLWYDTDAQSLKLYNVTLPSAPVWSVIFPTSGSLGYTPYNATNPDGFFNATSLHNGIAGTTNQVTVTTTGSGVTLSLPQSINTTADVQFNTLTLVTLTASSFIANSFVYSNVTKALTSTSAPTNGQLLIGSTGAAPTVSGLTAGTAISVTNGAGSITINNTGVTSNVAGTGIGVSGSTGAVTITNNGVTSNVAGTGINVSGPTGAVTISNAGVTSNVAGTGIGVSGSTGAVTITNNGVTSLTGTSGQINVSGSTGSITISLPSSVTAQMPTGTVIHVAMNTPPTGYLAADGAAVSRSTYAALFTAIGIVFGSGNGTTTFNLPDLRGQFVRGWNSTGSGVDASRAFGSTQDHQLQTHTHTYDKTSPVINAGAGFKADDDDTLQQTISTGAPDGANVGTETRPTNVALLACIKT